MGHHVPVKLGRLCNFNKLKLRRRGFPEKGFGEENLKEVREQVRQVSGEASVFHLIPLHCIICSPSGSPF